MDKGNGNRTQAGANLAANAAGAIVDYARLPVRWLRSRGCGGRWGGNGALNSAGPQSAQSICRPINSTLRRENNRLQPSQCSLCSIAAVALEMCDRTERREDRDLVALMSRGSVTSDFPGVNVRFRRAPPLRLVAARAITESAPHNPAGGPDRPAQCLR